MCLHWGDGEGQGPGPGSEENPHTLTFGVRVRLVKVGGEAWWGSVALCVLAFGAGVIWWQEKKNFRVPKPKFVQSRDLNPRVDHAYIKVLVPGVACLSLSEVLGLIPSVCII